MNGGDDERERERGWRYRTVTVGVVFWEIGIENE